MRPDKKANAKGSKKKATKKKAKKDPNEPPKPVSAYASFFRDTQAAIKGQNPNATFGEVSKIVASMWDSLALEKKNDYKEKADAAKKEYHKTLAAYRATQAAVLEEPEELEPPPPETHEFSSPIPPSSPTSSSPEVIARIVVTRPISPTELVNNVQDDDEEPEVIETVKKDEEVEPIKESEVIPEPLTTKTTVDVPTPVAQETKEVSGPVISNGTLAKPESAICLRSGCNNPAIDSPEWDREYCSNECVVEHCSAIFMAHVATRMKKAEEMST